MSSDNGNEFKCPECDFIGKNKNGLNRHLKYNHLKEGETKPERLKPDKELIKIMVSNYQNHTYEELANLLKISQGQLLTLIAKINKKYRLKDGSDLLPKKILSKTETEDVYRVALSELGINFEERPEEPKE
jgi:hypothetical protein